jgi:spermidine synthase
VILYLLSVGFVSILAQVVVLRELNVAFFGVELIYILAIAVWLLSTALGALAGGRGRGVGPADVARPFVWFSLLLPADIALIRSLREIAGGIPGTFLPFGVQLVGLAAALVPVGIVLGLLFRRAATLYIAEPGAPAAPPGARSPGAGRTLARAYAIESAGGLAGGLLSTVFLAAGLANFAIGIVCAATAVITVIAARTRRALPRRVRAAAIAALVLLAAVGIASPLLDLALTRITHPTLVASRDSPYGRVSVTRQGGQFVVYENDALAFETQSVAAEELVHLAAVNAAELDRVLVLGGGLEGTVTEIAKYRPERVDVVEINRVLVSLTGALFPAGYRAALSAPGVFFRIADPRRFLAHTAERYDLVLIGAADPSSGETNRFFTRDFFAECRGVLDPGGVVALRLRSSENIWTPFLSYRNSSVIKALDEVFDDVVVLPGTTNVVIASDRPLSRDPDLLGAAFRKSGVATKLVTPEYIHYLYTNDRFGEIARRLSATPVAPNTDSRPVCYKYSSLMWLSKFFPKLITREVGAIDLTAGRGVFVVLALTGATGALFIFVRRRVRLRRTALAALAGFVGMVLETVMILHYQAENGVLYQNLGILLTAFMAGLAAGAGTVPRFARSGIDNPGSPKRICGLTLVGAFAALSFAAIGLLRAGAPAGLWFFSLLLFVCGFVVAGVFAYASFMGTAGQESLIGPMYAADLIGGCAGSVLCSIFLVPFVGMEQTAGVALLASVLGFLAV